MNKYQKSRKIKGNIKPFRNVKRRVAKKYLNSKEQLLKRISWAINLPYHAIVQTCSFFNEIVLNKEIYWKSIGKYGIVAFQVDFQTTGSSCSLQHCGVEEPWTKQKIEQEILAFDSYSKIYIPNQESYHADLIKQGINIFDDNNLLLFQYRENKYVFNEDGTIKEEFCNLKDEHYTW